MTRMGIFTSLVKISNLLHNCLSASLKHRACTARVHPLMLIKSERKPLIEIITFQQKVTKLCTKQLTKFEHFRIFTLLRKNPKQHWVAIPVSSQDCQYGYFKLANPGLFLFISVLFKHKFYRKTVGFIGIGTFGSSA